MLLLLIKFHRPILKPLWPNIRPINQERFLRFFNGLGSIMNVKILFALLITFIAYALFFLQSYFIALAINIPLPLLFIVFAVSSASLAASLPISIWGIGTREAVFVFTFKTIGISTENALSFSFLLFVINYLCCGFIGLLAMFEFHNILLIKKISDRPPRVKTSPSTSASIHQKTGPASSPPTARPRITGSIWGKSKSPGLSRASGIYK